MTHNTRRNHSDNRRREDRGGYGEKNRALGLVQRRAQDEARESAIVQEKIVKELERLQRESLERDFMNLKKTLAVAENTDHVWQQERQEIAKMLNEIREKRSLLSALVETNPSTSLQKNLETRCFLIDQQQRLSLLGKETSERYMLDAFIPPV